MKGLGVSEGIAFAKIMVLNEDSIQIKKEAVDDVEKELERLQEARRVAVSQLEELVVITKEGIGQKEAEIFEAHILMLESEDFFNEIKDYMTEHSVNCEWALDIVTRKWIDYFSNIDNEYLKERAVDLADISKRLLYLLSGKSLETLPEIDEKVILAAKDLTPSQAANIKKDKIAGIIMESGGKTSHTVIIANTLGIPCIAGVENLLETVRNGQYAIVNGSSGEIILSPTEEEIERVTSEIRRIEKETKELLKYRDLPAKTKDGFKIKLFANISLQNDIDLAIENGAEGVGLFRTEFIYMNGRTVPSEETQFEIYSYAAKKLKGKPLIIRTLDVGGDKKINYLGIPEEENPFLGFRAIRYSLDNIDIFKTQLSAILRASVYGNIEIMFPMIATLGEFRKVKEVLEEVKNELKSRNIFFKDVKTGIMVEIPSAALMAEKFAKEVDFFSIGTNDLTQYLFAADRTNQKVAYLNSYYHPALLKVIKHVVDQAHKSGKKVGICGQAGQEPSLMPVWLAMGIDEVSISPAAILKTKKIVLNLAGMGLDKHLEKVLSFDEAIEVEEYLKSVFKIQ